jgi:hypothetical protein
MLPARGEEGRLLGIAKICTLCVTFEENFAQEKYRSYGRDLSRTSNRLAESIIQKVDRDKQGEAGEAGEGESGLPAARKIEFQLTLSFRGRRRFAGYGRCL